MGGCGGGGVAACHTRKLVRPSRRSYHCLRLLHLASVLLFKSLGFVLGVAVTGALAPEEEVLGGGGGFLGGYKGEFVFSEIKHLPASNS